MIFTFDWIKGIVFFFLFQIIFYTFLEKIDWLNGKAVFFFPAAKKKYRSQIDWMIDIVNFFREKKAHKRNSFWKKKNWLWMSWNPAYGKFRPKNSYFRTLILSTKKKTNQSGKSIMIRQKYQKNWPEKSWYPNGITKTAKFSICAL